jgi:phage terminase large subunit GpA-like protein
MFNDDHLYIPQYTQLIQGGIAQLSDIKPSDWTEKKVMMGKPRPGPFRYDYTPYVREIIDCLAPDHPARKVAVMKGSQIGFALHIDTPIPTPDGFKKMSDLKAGDYVFNEFGKPVLVTMATDFMYGHKCYKVTFTDGTEIIADAEHLWTVFDLKDVERTLNTEYIAKRFKKTGISGKIRNRYYVNNSKPIEGVEKKLPFDPYLLGLWLGDGCKSSNAITATKDDAEFYRDELHKKGIKVTITPYADQPNTVSMRIQAVFNKWMGGSNIYGHKHIPDIYFTASVNQRLELLQGLIDTYGHVMKGGCTEFYNIDRNLIEQVRVLIASIGYKVTMREGDNSGKETIIHPTRRYKMKNIFILNFKGTKELPVARLPRKAERLMSDLDIRKEIHKRWISNVEEVESSPVKCISVDSPTHLYLASKSYIPTHNSSGVIYPGIGWMIEHNPGNCYLMVGSPDLVPKAMVKIDLLLTAADLRRFISDQSGRERKGKTGDTNLQKDFPGGYVSVGNANNHKNIAQVDLQYIFLDDLDKMKGTSAASGDLIKLIENRAKAYKDIYKEFLISTPLLKGTSLIEPAYLLGDRRKRMIECPCCHDPIIFRWKVSEGEVIDPLTEDIAIGTGGIHYDINNHGQVIDKSVGYICYKCSGFFNDKDKYNMLNGGFWKPTAIPSWEGYRSYHIPSLYAPIGMFDWVNAARDYEEAHPAGVRIESKYQVFVNEIEGETYQLMGTAPKAAEIQSNQRPYNIGEVPELQSIKDGNGRIVLLTFGSDCNGTVYGVNGATKNDARIDYEIVAHSENGATYSVVHGSVGTFIPLEGTNKADREYWTYEHNKPNSVWPVVHDIITRPYISDDGKYYYVNTPGIDTGAYTNFVESYIDWTIGRNPSNPVVGVRGKREEAYLRNKQNIALFEQGKARTDVYFLQVGLYKDKVSENMKLKWDGKEDQPANFMNFPFSERYVCPAKLKHYQQRGVPYTGDLLYQYDNYFEHFESEERKPITLKDGAEAFRWVKRKSNVKNHLWDCRIYNEALRDIIVRNLQNILSPRPKEFVWTDYVRYVLGVA